MSTLGKLKKKLILQSIQNNQQAQQGQNAQQGIQNNQQDQQGQNTQQGAQNNQPVEKIILKDLYEKTVEKKSLNNPEFIKFLKRVEEEERKNLTDKNYLYPTLYDPNFNIKIRNKKEFNDTKYDDKIHDVKTHGEEICKQKEFELSPTQMFVRNFLSFQTPYNNLLLYHGLGTGKTCSAISVCEEMRGFMKEMGISKRIIIVASPNVQDNFKLQLFDPRKLKNINGLWNMRACTGNSFLKEINPMYMKGLDRDKVIRQIGRIIRTSYLFMGYTEFSNYITRILQKFKETKEQKAIQKEFNNRLIVIDEVHNIRSTSDNKQKKIANNLLKLVKFTENLKLLLLSATPMFNSYKEIIWLLNLMNLNDNRFPIKISEVFDKDGNFILDEDGNEKGKELLIQKARGYISFVRGENPYTFPYRIYPSEFLTKDLLKDMEYPRKQINSRDIITGIQFLDLFISKLGDYQENAYNKIIEEIKEDFPSFSKMESGVGYTVLDKPLQILNMVYPSIDFDRGQKNIKLHGLGGLNRTMNYDKETKRNFSYKADTLNNYGRIFSNENLFNYSGKIYSICEHIKRSKGIVLIYSQFINGGCVPLALALEEMGFIRYNGRSLLKEPKPKINALTLQEIKDSKEPVASYVMITGDQKLSPRNKKEVDWCTNDDNINGEKVKVIIISRAGSEGLDFKNIRQVHILEPWYNLNRIEQIIGRAVRFCSHIKLPFEERNTEIYLYGSRLKDNDIESADLYVYRLAETKAIQIAVVSRILKENAVDCLLNKGQIHLSSDILNQKVTQNLSSGISINYEVGDHSETSVCDYMKECVYACCPNIDKVEIDEDTYNEKFILMNIEKIIIKIRNLMKDHYIYKKTDIIKGINRVHKYPLVQIYAALNQLINDKNEYITDMLGRIGHLVNIGDYYMFQPVELENKFISYYERRHPIDYKREKLGIHLREKIQKFDIQEEIDIKAIIKNMQEKLDGILIPKRISSGDNDWYKYCSLTFIRLKDYITEDLLFKYILHHIVDCEYLYKKDLINYIYYNPELTDFESKIKNYLDTFIIERDKVKAILFYSPQSERPIRVGVFDKNKLRKILPTEFATLYPRDENKWARPAIDINKINDVVGFMTIFKSEKIVFKLKDMMKKRNKGARCDQITKKTIIPILKKIKGDKLYPELILTQKITGEKKQKKISAQQLCCELELILRYYDDIGEKDLRWFLSTPDVKVNNIETKTKN